MPTKVTENFVAKTLWNFKGYYVKLVQEFLRTGEKKLRKRRWKNDGNNNEKYGRYCVIFTINLHRIILEFRKIEFLMNCLKNCFIEFTVTQKLLKMSEVSSKLWCAEKESIVSLFFAS